MLNNIANFHMCAVIAAAVAMFGISSHSKAQCQGDLNGDGVVGVADFSKMLVAWGPSTDGDVNSDGVTDYDDFSILLAAWGDCPPACQDNVPFTYVVIPDTQFFTAYYNGSTPEMFYQQTQWIADNIDDLNVAFVSHLGDIVEFGWIDGQWNIANTAMSTLDGLIPYGLTFGNHDADDAVWGRSDIKYNQYFPPSRYEGNSWYGGGYPEGKNTNSFQFFEAGCEAYLVLHLQWDPPADVRVWADEVIAAHPDKRVIVSTHEFPGNYLLWNEVLTHHNNVFLVVSGHECARERYLPLTNDYGTTVHSILSDYQCDNPTNSLLRYYTFDPSTDQVEAFTYSPLYDYYEIDNSSSFTFDISYGEVVSCEEQGTSPYGDGPISVPGRIEAEYYDEGCNGFAYYDLDNYNQGGEFRTDGVDIEIATDIEQGYNIGWLYNGEWLNYTIDVAATGSYTFDFRVASNDSGSEMYWALDGVALTELIAIPSTGSWQTWITITKPDIQLEAGEHTLTLHITDGEFNLNYVDISQASP
ncbi:MAG: carbohydrate-binding protein [Phycisphaerales bacterium]|nr:carbohydrate-binding protein [Phycisphaerales bacterium]